MAPVRGALSSGVMRPSALISVFTCLALALSGCASPRAGQGAYDYRGSCGSPGRNEKAWKLVGKIPRDVAELRLLADYYPPASGDLSGYSVESWFEMPSGDVMLCRTEGAPQGACITTWWAFCHEADTWRVVDKGALVCVT